MKKNIVVFLIIALIIFVGFHYWGETVALKTENNYLNSKIDTLLNDADIKNLLMENVLNQFRCEDSDVALPLFLIDENNNKKNIGELSNDSPVLVFRFSEYNCGICSEFQIKIIKEFMLRYGENGIILITTFRNKRDLMIFKKINNLSIPIYRVDKNLLNPVIEELNFPYYFILNTNGTMNSVHIPAKEVPLITQQYLQIVGEKYLKIN